MIMDMGVFRGGFTGSNPSEINALALLLKTKNVEKYDNFQWKTPPKLKTPPKFFLATPLIMDRINIIPGKRIYT